MAQADVDRAAAALDAAFTAIGGQRQRQLTLTDATHALAIRYDQLHANGIARRDPPTATYGPRRSSCGAPRRGSPQSHRGSGSTAPLMRSQRNLAIVTRRCSASLRRSTSSPQPPGESRSPRCERHARELDYTDAFVNLVVHETNRTLLVTRTIAIDRWVRPNRASALATEQPRQTVMIA
jgi:hypothetical protein